MSAAGAGPACCQCLHRRRASPLACLAICCLVLAYNLLGAFLFLALEGPAAPDGAVAASKPNLSLAPAPPPPAGDLRAATVERLWSITEDLNILYKENWTKLAAKELMDFQRVLVRSLRGPPPRPPQGQGEPHDLDHRWTFSSSFLYALTLITTIGGGEVSPLSPAGRLAAVAYACLGIPLVLLYLATLGDALARRLRALYSRLRPARPALCPACPARRAPPDRGKRDPAKPELPKRTPFEAALNLETFAGGGGGGGGGGAHWTCRDHTPVPALLGVALGAGYVALGAALFHVTERWTLVDGCYFSFSSLATIGFGALRPGRGGGGAGGAGAAGAAGACCAYILVGVVVVATCFNLVHDEGGGPARGALAQLCRTAPAPPAPPAPAAPLALALVS